MGMTAFALETVNKSVTLALGARIFMFVVMLARFCCTDSLWLKGWALAQKTLVFRLGKDGKHRHRKQSLSQVVNDAGQRKVKAGNAKIGQLNHRSQFMTRSFLGKFIALVNSFVISGKLFEKIERRKKYDDEKKLP